jgi:hypothetical protein
MDAGGDLGHRYLVECFTPGVERGEVQAAARRATRAAAELRVEGEGIAYEGAILLVADEVVFHLFRGPSEGAVREASERAAIPFERILERVEIDAVSEGHGGRPCD